MCVWDGVWLAWTGGKGILGLSSDLSELKRQVECWRNPVYKPFPSLPPKCWSEFPSLPYLSCELRWSLQVVFWPSGPQKWPVAFCQNVDRATNMETVDLLCMHSKLLRFGVGMYLSCQVIVSSLFPPPYPSRFKLGGLISWEADMPPLRRVS